MPLLLVALLILYSAASEVQGYGFQDCKKALGANVLEVLPGGGWDNLRNVEMGTVMSVNYSLCRTTEDGDYIIPNDIYVIARKQSSVEINSELIESWLNYTDGFSRSINAEASFLSLVNGKFSSSSQETKMHNVYDQTVTTRVQVRHHIYSVKAAPNFAFDSAFKKQLIDIGNKLENNQSREAEYVAELLVLNYGTHVLTSLEAGASLVQEDQIKKTFMLDHISLKAAVTAAASATFFSKINVGIGGGTQVLDDVAKSYMENTVDSKIESHGSIPFYPGITLQKWQEGISNRLVSIDKFGLPLPFFINVETLSDLPEPTVKRVAATLERAIRLYYAVNTHPGCVNINSRNFNFQANVDDGSCQDANTNFTFGGIYQECQGLFGEDTEELCQSYRTKNPLTGDFSCPPNYIPILMHGEERSVTKPKTECHKSCHRCWLVAKCCHTECGINYYSSKVHFNAYWCAALAPVPQNSGFLFGGLYSVGEVNPLTGTNACPSYFYPLSLFENLKVCVSDDYEMGFQFSVPFGGFFSCESGNPLTGLLKGQSPGLLQDFFYQNPTDYPMKCPTGYSQHKAYISDGCQVLYCLQAGTLFAQRLPPINLPPFLWTPSFNSSTSQAVLVRAEGSKAWVKLQGTNLWKLANATDEEKLSMLLNPEFSRGPSGGAVAGITIAVTALLAAVIIAVIYGVRHYKNRGFKEVQPRHLVENHESYGTIESNPDTVTDSSA
ncbi:macrophage-expressed gene 1 protein-like [Rhinatrema bivittatum]|uniref:macrophage-expressed gene 1 protein-like n=1 Tax=Rhinatrema bivittatum TaxID=194408 RepID=UPI00112AAC69|nr:macrophage-expressed gene 1 protein-like [Rhinatrema bivittatum]